MNDNLELIPLENPGKIILQKPDKDPEYGFECESLGKDPEGRIRFIPRDQIVNLLEGACILCHVTEDGKTIKTDRVGKYWVHNPHAVERTEKESITIQQGPQNFSVPFVITTTKELVDELLEKLGAFVLKQ
jgi:hypothetical protein